MRTRLIVTAACLVLSAAPALSEPQKTRVEQPRQPRPAQVVLASADQLARPATDEQTQTPAKRPRIARVTTCRCGDPQAAPAEEQ